jgi:hypothetical protein
MECRSVTQVRLRSETPPIALMSIYDSDRLLDRMVHLDETAYEEFQTNFREPLLQRCMEFGMDRREAEVETERCLFALGVMIPQCAGEIPSGGLEEWLLAQTRNLIVRYWREHPPRSQNAVVAAMPPAVAWTVMSQLGDRGLPYRQAALVLAMPLDWLRTQHRRMLAQIERILRQGEPTMRTLEKSAVTVHL